MTGRLIGKVALVTGSANGIGRATSLLLAQEGATVIVTDLQEAKGRSLAAEIEGRGGQALFQLHDVAQEDAWIATVAIVDQQYGRLDILVNNAGITHAGPITGLELELWRRQMAVNLDGVFLGLKYGVPLMRRSGGGSIINVSSIAALKPSANTACYAASKAAVRALTKSVALECAAEGDGIRVNSIHPGYIETAIWDSLIGLKSHPDDGAARAEALDALVGDKIPLGKMGEPIDIAQGILWLAGEESRYVTGTELVVDGGRSIA